jgi:outer membrane protein assembly factor BamB
MRCFLAASLATLVLTTSALTQRDRYTTPEPPAREVLDRLNLRLAWRAYVPMDGRRDALESIRLTGKSLLIQTRSGLVTQLDAETGQVNWRNRVGNAYQTLQPPAFNNNGVFVINNNYLFGLDRNDGRMQFQMPLPGSLSAPPVADEDQIYLPTVQGRLRVYRLPNIQAERENRDAKLEEEARRELAKGPTAKPSSNPQTAPSGLALRGEFEKFGPRPEERWAVPTNLLLDFQPIISGETVALASSSGNLLACEKFPSPGNEGRPFYKFKAEDQLLASPGQYENTVYFGSRDANVYAIDLLSGRVVWRHTAGSPVHRRPFATRDDLYVSSDRNGLSRLQRETRLDQAGPSGGDALWSIPRGKRTLNSQPDLDRVLAVNPKFVYATDRSGRLAIVDRIHGTILSNFDIRDFVFLTPNEWTDRIYLAAQNGLIICLHDREYVHPFFHREQDHSLARKLLRAVNIPAADGKLLKDVVRDLELDLQLKIMISARAFKEQGIDNIESKPVSFKKIENASLRDALKEILKPIKATFEPIEETIVIVPTGKALAVPADKDKDKDNDKEKNGKP